MMAADWFYFSFLVLYLVHMHEEYWSGFAYKFPPPRLVGTFTERGFWVLNPFLLSFVTAVGVANLMGASGHSSGLQYGPQSVYGMPQLMEFGHLLHMHISPV